MVIPACKSQTLTLPSRIMRLRPSSLIIQLLALAILSVFTTLSAQTPATPATPATNLDQLDSTYHTNLRKYHAPVIQDYLRELNKLKQALAGRSRDMDAALVQAEIDKVNKLASIPGLLPYDSLSAPAADRSAKVSTDKKMEAAIVLSLGSETRGSPDNSTLKVRPTGKALPIGAAEWAVEKITPGKYRVAMQYTCPEISEGVVITARIGTASVQRKLTSEDITGSLDEFRFAKLGTLTIDQEFSKEHFILQCPEPTKAFIWVRQVILTKIKDAENK